MSLAGTVTSTQTDEWAVQCVLHDGSLHTGRPMTTRIEAQASGERLERINGADWWLVTRCRTVTVEATPWTDAAEVQR